MRYTHLNRPVARYLIKRKLVVRITETGLDFKVHRRHGWRTVTWEQIATLAGNDLPVSQHIEQETGRAALKAMGATE